MNITILGAGAYGIALSSMFLENNCNITMWTKRESEKEILEKERCNNKVLPGYKISEKINFTTNLKKDVEVTFEGSEMQTCLFVVITAEGWETADHRLFQINDEKVSWSVDEKWNFLKADGNEYVYYQVLKPNTVMEGQDIIQNGTVAVSNTLTKSDMDSMEDLSIKFEAIAAQYNSSEKDVMATWNVVR